LKKVLVITYYWPPAGGATINRIFKFTQYLPEFGWEPVILTTKDGDFPFIDESLLKEINPDTKVFRSSGFSLHKIFKKISPKSNKNFVPYGFTDRSKNSFMDNLSRWVKYNFIPDTRFPWYFGTVKQAIRIIREEKIDLIFSSSPPQTNHMVARKAARKTGIPWVADFRDPWTDVFWLASDTQRMKWIHRWDQRIERKTINRMNAVITVGPSLVKILSRKTNNPINLIPNGYDERYFTGDVWQRSDKFRIIYAGSISREQDPVCFFNSLSAAMKDEGLQRDMEMLWLGNFPTYIHDLIDSLPYKEQIHFSPYTHYSESIHQIRNSDLLLLIIPKTADNECIITSKIFEYIGAAQPIICYGPVQGDAGIVLQQTGCGEIFDYSDAEGGSRFILEKYKAWKQQTGNGIPAATKEYSRKALTGKLAEVFESCMNQKDGH
jgi:glycosyltransferase involved in cell wall biosynthesis